MTESPLVEKILLEAAISKRHKTKIDDMSSKLDLDQMTDRLEALTVVAPSPEESFSGVHDFGFDDGTLNFMDGEGGYTPIVERDGLTIDGLTITNEHDGAAQLVFNLDVDYDSIDDALYTYSLDYPDGQVYGDNTHLGASCDLYDESGTLIQAGAFMFGYTPEEGFSKSKVEQYIEDTFVPNGYSAENFKLAVQVSIQPGDSVEFSSMNVTVSEVGSSVEIGIGIDTDGVPYIMIGE